MSEALAGAQPAFSALALDGGIDTTEGPTDGGETTPPGDGSGTSGSTVDLGGGYGFELPAGYTVEQQGDGFAMVFGDGGYFFALLTPPPATWRR